MEMDNLIEKVKKYNIPYSLGSTGEIDLKVVHNVYIRVKYKEDGSIEICDFTRSGNVISGLLSMSFSTYLVYGCILFVFLCALATYEMYLNPKSIILISMVAFISAVGFIVTVVYFSVRLESMKRLIMKWTDKS